MISFNSINKTYGDQVLFEDLSFSINRRERVGLVGRNGHGKTTLLRILLGQESAESGDISIPRRYRIGHLEQHIAFSRPTIVEEVALGLPQGREDELWRAEKILSGLGFSDEDMTRPPELFSGGFQVRINLARVLVSEPDLLLLDEPTNYLDIISIRWLSRFLSAWPSELILITHDRSFMDNVVTHTVAIHRRRAKKIEGSTDKLYTQILQEEEIYEKTRLNDEKKRKEVERFVERFRAKNTLATRVQSRIKFLEKHERMEQLEHIQTLDFSFKSADFPTRVMMRMEDVSFAWNSSPELFQDLSLEIHARDRICVIGQNGRGKSTLLRLLAGDLALTKGKRHVHARVVPGYFAQTNVRTLQPQRTVLEEIQRADAGCLPQTARDVAGVMMFEGDLALKKVEVLSGGEKSRVMLGRLIVTPSNLLLLDEPTNHLDMDSCDSLLAAVDDFHGAVVMVTHNEMFLRTLATRFIIFDRGRVIVFEGSYQDFLDSIGWESDDAISQHRGAELVAPSTAAEAPRGPQMDKKSLRQARARILKERTKAVGPLEKRVSELESDIMSTEAEAVLVLRGLEEASVQGDAPRIAELSQKHPALRARIDVLYQELDSVSLSLESRARSFDDELAALE